MQLTKSYFNRAIFGKTVKRYWPLWAMYLLVITFALGTCAKSCIDRFSNVFYHIDMLEFSWKFCLFFCFAACCLSAMLVHSWMYNARSTSAYSALPVCRNAMFISISLAGIVPLIVCNLIAALTAFIVALLAGHVILITALQCFLVISLECIFFYGLACFIAPLTGHVFVLPVIYAIFNFLVIVVEYLIKVITSEFVFGATMNNIELDFLSPIVYLLNSVSAVGDEIAGHVNFNSWAPFIIYALAGIVLAVFGLLIFRRRKMETASDVVAVQLLKPIFKYCLCFGCALVIGLVLFELVFSAFFVTADPRASLIICLCMLVGGFVGYYAAEMLMKKSFRVFRKSWKGLLVSCAVIILFITAIENDFFGYERRIPELGDIDSASISIWGESTDFVSAGEIADVMLLHQRIINNKKQSEKDVYNYYSKDIYTALDGVSTTQVKVKYNLNNGHSLVRSYRLLYSQNDKFFTDLLDTVNRPELILHRTEKDFDFNYIEYAYISFNYDLPQNGEEEQITSFDAPASTTVYTADGYASGSLQLTAQQARSLYENAIKKDIANGDICRISRASKNYKDKIDIYIEFSARVPINDGYDSGYSYNYLYIGDISENAVYTVAALKKLGLDLEELATYAAK